ALALQTRATTTARSLSKRQSSPHPPCRAPSPARGEGKRDAERAEICFGSASALFWLCCAGCAVNGAPMRRRSGGGIARRVARRDASQLVVSAGMHCQPTPEPLREVGGQEPGDRCIGVAFSLVTFSWPRKRK